MKFDRPLGAKLGPEQCGRRLATAASACPLAGTTCSRLLRPLLLLTLLATVCAQSAGLRSQADGARNETLAERGPISAAEARPEVGGGAHDEVISASEILQNLHQRKGEEEPEEPEGEQEEVARHLQSASLAANQSEQGQQQTSQQEQTSRLLLQLLVLSLLTLVSSSLAIVYAIKYCVCQVRRKRQANQRLQLQLQLQMHQQQQQHLHQSQCRRVGHSACSQRSARCPAMLLRSALVADSNLSIQQQSQLCPAAAALVPARRRSSGSSFSSLRAPDGLCAPGAGHQLLVNACECASRPTAQLPSEPIWTSPSPLAAACPGCPVHELRPEASPADRLRPPPAYSDLFGPLQARELSLLSSARARLSSCSSSSAPICAFAGGPTAAPPGQPERAQTSSPADSSTSTSGVHLSTATLTAPSGHTCASVQAERQHHEQANLLVRLNLNKTKLLSAADLMLLSKLIDVPIVISQQAEEEAEGEGEEEDVTVGAGGEEEHRVVGEEPASVAEAERGFLAAFQCAHHSAQSNDQENDNNNNNNNNGHCSTNEPQAQ